MNIFYLDPNPKKCAQYHVDKHCVKMILEYAQLLSTAHRILDGVEELVPYTPVKIINHDNNQFSHLEFGKPKVRKDMTMYHSDIYMDDKLYRHTHMNHPSAVWARERAGNYIWLYTLFLALLEEYTHRYGKTHKTARLIPYLARIPKNINYDLERTDPTPAMDAEYRRATSLESYRVYYQEGKWELHNWKNRETPPFINAA